MAAAAHTGKLVIDIGQAAVPIEDHTGVSFRSDASYLITGGLGGFGLQLARWMAARGAGRLILVGRRGLQTPGAQEAMASLRALGAEAQIEAGDVASAEDVRRVVGAAPDDTPLRGVFHAAALLDDALIKNLDVERYRKTFGPKALGAWNLHEQTKDLSLDHFMCFSSMASVLGNQGSANYCAANAFVDALAHHRRRKGLAALTVNWGVIADVGMAADEDFYRQNLERNGLQTIHSSHCLELLGLLMATHRVQTTVCPIDLKTWLRFNPAGREGRLKDLLMSASAAPEASLSQTAVQIALRERLDSLDAQGQAQVALDAVRNIMAQVFRMDVATIEPHAVPDRARRRLADGDRDQDAAGSGGSRDVGDPAVEPELGDDDREDAARDTRIRRPCRRPYRHGREQHESAGRGGHLSMADPARSSR